MNIKKTIFAYIISFVALCVSFATLHNRIVENNKRPVTYIIRGGYGANEEMKIGFQSVKDWTDATKPKHSGAEYDGFIVNNTGQDLTDWSFSVNLGVDEVYIDSSWNGTFTVEGDKLIIEPSDEVKLIPNGEQKTFGMVLYAYKVLQFPECTLTAYTNKEYTEYNMFWLLLGLSIIWILCLIVRLVTLIKFRKMEERRMQDEKIISQTMSTLASMIDAKDAYTQGHSARVAEYTCKLAKELGMKDRELINLQYIALMHDCGKIAIPDEVLNKPGRLTDDEYKTIQFHTDAGGRILENFTAIEGIRDGALYHHEKYDGSGYPEGLKGDEIPYYARLIGVADSFDAMNSDRCYRRRLSRKIIVAELEKHSGTQFDPKIAAVMIKLIKEGKIETVDE